MTLEKILTSENILESINNNLEYLFELIPELKSMVGFEHKNPHHHLDVWNHTLYALSLSINNFEIRLVILLHDIGKPHSYTEGDIRHFKNHPIASSEISRKILERLNYDKDFINEVCYLVRYHDDPIKMKDIEENSELAYKRYLVQYCDTYAHHPLKLERRVKYLNRTKKIIDEYK